MKNLIDLQSYFDRIGYQDTPNADLQTLRDIQHLHTQTIPFENLNPFTGRPVLLDLDSIQQKLVTGRRGGYCFEQNHLLKAALQEIGFKVKSLAARVIIDKQAHEHSPFSHMLLFIELGPDQYIADVGFGGLTLTSPILLKPDMIQSTAHEDFRLLKQGDYFRLEASVKGEWKACFIFTLEEQFIEDYTVMNWYTSSHPQSHFTHTLVAARTFENGRYALRNSEMNTHFLDKPSNKKVIGNKKEMFSILEQIFSINISGLPDLEKQLDRLLS